MLSVLRSLLYMPILKWKMGERRAVASLPPAQHDIVAPLFIIPPVGAFDHEEKRALSPAEHITSFGPRLYDACGKRVVFVDGLHIDDEIYRLERKTHPLTELLERAHLAGAIACPATSIDRSKEYQEAVARFCKNDKRLPICIRVTPRQLESSTLRDDLQALIVAIDCMPERAVLVLDFAAMQITDAEGFADLVATTINTLPLRDRWLNIVTALTSFPDRPKVRAGECMRVPRVDWEVYKALINKHDELARFPAFGDYANEYPIFREAVRVSPVAQFRYSTSKEYLIEKGRTTKKPNGYGAIFPVADALTAKEDFAGPDFCEGDRFIYELSKRQRGHSSAPTWRWASTLHHLTLVCRSMRALFGRSEKAEPAEPEQESLFAELPGNERAEP